MMVQRILSMCDAALVADCEAIEFTLETDRGFHRLRLDCNKFPMLVQFLAFAVGFVENDDPPSGEFFPFDVTGLGIQDGETPDKTMLVAKVGRTALALQMPRNELNDMARRLQLAASRRAAGSKLN